MANAIVLARFWGGAALLSLLVLGLAISPAKAIEHYTDAQGTIHIKNDPSKQKTGPEAAKPAAPQPPPSVLRRPGLPGANRPPERHTGSAVPGLTGPPRGHPPVPPGAPPGAPAPKFSRPHPAGESPAPPPKTAAPPPPAPPVVTPGLPTPSRPPGAPGPGKSNGDLGTRVQRIMRPPC
jgi:hypothetical protein